MKNTKHLWLLIIPLLLITCSKSDGGTEIPPLQVQPPTVITLDATEVMENSATIGGNVSDDGGDPITERGICWATTNNPTLGNDHVQIGTGKGDYSSFLTELEANTTFYVRAYATNGIGTSYGNEISFTTLEKRALIYEGNVILRSQDMVDDFGDHNYTEITGDLEISYDINHPEWEPINNLEKLGSLTTIGGRLLMYGLDNLNSDDVLVNFSSIGGDIEIIGGNMTSLAFLKGIIAYNGSLLISNISTLQSLDGLENCTEINGNLIIAYNPNLTDIDALTNLTSVIGRLNIDFNDVLSNLNGLSRLTEVGRYLSIYGNNMLTNISGLKSLETVKWILSVEHCPLLANIDGLDNLLEVQGIEIIGNDALTNLNGLEQLITAHGIQESLVIGDNSSLTDIGVLALMTEGPDWIHIYGNGSLSNLNGLNNLTTVAKLDIIDNNALTEIIGLNNLISISQGLDIANNDNLTSISGFDNLSSFSGKLRVWYNENLTDLCGLAPLVNIGLEEQNFTVSGNDYNPSYQDLVDGKCSP